MSHIPPHLSPAYTDLGNSLSRTRLAGEQGEVRTGSKTGFQLRRLPVRPERGQDQTHTRSLAGLNIQDSVNIVRVSDPAVHVPHRSTHSNRKASPSRSAPHETHTVALENQLEGPRITRKVIPVPRSLHPSLKWWLEESNVLPGQPLHPLKHALQIFTDASKKGWGSLKRTHCKGNLVPSRKQVAHKPSGTKGGLSGLKRVQRPLFEQHSSGGHRQHKLKKEGGCMPSVCPSVENPDLVYQETGNPQSSTHPRLTECDSRQAIQASFDHSDRMVPSPRGLPSHMIPVTPAPSGSVCHQV